MKILFITSSYLPHYGGLETVVREISSRMREQGNQVAIIANRYPRSLKKQEVIDGITVTRMFFIYPTWDLLKSGYLTLWFVSIFIFPLTLGYLFFYLLKFKPDVVNLHYPNDQTLFLWILSYLFSFRLIVSLHGGDVDAEPYKNDFKLWLFRCITKKAYSVTTCSQALLNQAEKLQANIHTKSIVIHNGVYTQLFFNANPYQHKRRYILGVGRLEYHKGFDLLIEAFTNIVSEIPEIDLLIVGEGSQQPLLQTLIHEKHLTSRIYFLGRKTREEVASLMKGTETLIIPSRREPFGIVGLEGMASGRPIIATQIEGLKEALEGAEVHWFNSNDVNTLTKMLYTLLQDKQLMTSSKLNSELAVSKDWNRVSDLYISSYNNLL